MSVGVYPQAGRLESLSESECIRLLRSHSLGRIGVTDHESRPLIFPVNYFFDDGVVVFRTGAGTKLDLAPGSQVCFEIDRFDSRSGVGWSVLVSGMARDVTHPRGMPTARMRFLPVAPLAPGPHEHWVGIWADEITGRRFKTSR